MGEYKNYPISLLEILQTFPADELRAKAEDIFFEKYNYKEFIEMLEEACQAMAFAMFSFFAPMAKSDLTSRSKDTLGSPFSILATLD